MKIITRQQIDKLLSFKHEELASRVNSILHGDDKDFPGVETCKSIGAEFLTAAYENILDYKFRNNFLEILHGLVDMMISGAWLFLKGDLQKQRLNSRKNIVSTY